MQGLITAISWMTVLPIPRFMRVEFDIKTATPWLPVVGLLIGFLLMVVTWLGALLDPWLGALFGVILWFGITGFLHADGLADLADALGAEHGVDDHIGSDYVDSNQSDRSRFLEVLKDPHIGSFGVMVLVLLVASKLVLLMLLVKNELWVALVLIPVWSRWASMWWMSLPSLSEGSASNMAKHLPSSVFLWSYGIVLCLAGFVWADGLWLALVFAGLWYLFLRYRLGGMNGDCLGAGIEVTEVLMLMSCVVFV